MKVALLLSGGVDSSVALHLLLREGHEVTAFYLKIWLEDELSFLGECPWEEDLSYARAVCQAAGVPLEVIPLQREYHERVVTWAIEELRAGRTPSPDIFCNQRVKYGAFFDVLTMEYGDAFEKVASGHYARLELIDGSWHLLRGVDPVKDQTYFLFRLDQQRLARCLFPLGHLNKQQVRRLAQDFSLPNQARRDSQGICFLGKIRFDDFVRSYLGEQPGEIRDLASGQCLGEHRGMWFHTIGQRRGLGLSGGPWYVAAKDVEHNILFVTHGQDLLEHRCDSFFLEETHWIVEAPTQRHLDIRIRHTPQTTGCQWHSIENGRLHIHLGEPDPGVADGQVAVLYHGEFCVGGGTIVTSSTLQEPVRSHVANKVDQSTFTASGVKGPPS
jgi:tRNA-specific 2-thiouridylase